MTGKLYPGSSYIEVLHFKINDGELADPDSVTVEFLAPDGTVAGSLGLANLTRLSLGEFKLKWDLPSDAVKGCWVRRVTFTVGDEVSPADVEPFDVATQPYGVLSMVRRLCNMSAADAENSELTADLMGYLSDATDWINLELLEAGESALPLDPVPPRIDRIASYYAAGLFLSRPPAEGRHHYVGEAEADLERYIAAKYGDAGVYVGMA